MPHFLDIHKVGAAELRGILRQARAMKAARRGRPRGAPDDGQPLAGHMVALIFEKPSTRTRVSFDVGVRQMGGQTMVLASSDMQLGRGESIADTARVLNRYVDLIVLRTFKHSTLLEMAASAEVPVVNGLTNRTHPCQVMADVMTYEEHRGAIAGKKVVWVGDGNNMCHSFLHAAARFGFELTITGPESLPPDDDILDYAQKEGAQVALCPHPQEAVQGADLVVTDAWASLHDAPQTHALRQDALRPYQVNRALMSHAKPDALFMHCLPAHRNEEATDAVMDGPHSVVFDEAENRLHAQKSILRWSLGL